jgi:hypothetical protein
MGERRSAYRALVGKPEERRLLERPSRRWKDSIKMEGELTFTVSNPKRILQCKLTADKRKLTRKHNRRN